MHFLGDPSILFGIALRVQAGILPSAMDHPISDLVGILPCAMGRPFCAGPVSIILFPKQAGRPNLPRPDLFVCKLIIAQDLVFLTLAISPAPARAQPQNACGLRPLPVGLLGLGPGQDPKSS